MRYLVAYTERRKNAVRRVVTKGYSSRQYFNSVEEATARAYRLDTKKFKVEILTSDYELVKEL